MGIGGRMNNYEKIKSMSVDEMAEFLSKLEYYEIGKNCPDNTSNDDCLAPFCTYGIKQWLLAESEG